jgi:uncharacterized protein YutE (UPF0331/DUF86 family)
MTAEEIQTKLAMLRDNLERLAQIPQATYEEFAADFRNLDSALHRLQTSIQALIDVGGFVLAERGLGAPGSSREILERLEAAGILPVGATLRFGPIFGFRNRVVHLYDRIDPEIVYRVLTSERGDLVELLRLLLDALEPPALNNADA